MNKATIKHYLPSVLFCLALVILLGIVGQMDYDDAVKTCLQATKCKVN